MLMPSLIEQGLNNVTTVDYRCCADHSVLITSHAQMAVTAVPTAAVVSAVYCTLLQQSEHPEQYIATPQFRGEKSR